MEIGHDRVRYLIEDAWCWPSFHFRRFLISLNMICSTIKRCEWNDRHTKVYSPTTIPACQSSDPKGAINHCAKDPDLVNDLYLCTIRHHKRETKLCVPWRQADMVLWFWWWSWCKFNALPFLLRRNWFFVSHYGHGMLICKSCFAPWRYVY